jgi:hypothetical protein
MTITDITNLMHTYYDWLRDKTAVTAIDGEWSVITTPYLDRHNDYLQLYVRPTLTGGLELSDDGYTIADLASTGCDLQTPRRTQLLQTTLNGLGVNRIGDTLTVHCTYDQFANKKHHLVQAMLAVNDIFYTATANQPSIFIDDVSRWLDSHEVRYTSHIKLTGTSGLDHVFDFVIPKSRQAPERLVQVINHPNNDATKLTLFQFTDIRTRRTTDSTCIVLINDEHTIRSSIIDSFHTYDITTMLWSARHTRFMTFTL